MPATGPTLARLILDRKDGRSFQRLSDDCGGQPAARRLQQMTVGSRPMHHFPDPETIQAIATGLDVSTADVVLACARSLGLDVDAAGGSLLVAGAGALPETARQAVFTVAQALVDAHSSHGS